MPTTLDEALDMMVNAPHPLTPIAGGTDLAASWHLKDKRDLRLLDLTHLRDPLKPFRLRDDYLEFGALTSYWDAMASSQVNEAFPLLVDAARQVGAVQVQARGTWVGNIGTGSPAADGVTVMMAYDATVVLRSRRERRLVPLHRYYLGYKQAVRQPDELIVAVRMPKRSRRVHWFHKVAARRVNAVSKVGVAVVQDALGWRVVANSVAPCVCRCRHIEAVLEAGGSFDSEDDIRRTLKEDISPINDLRSTAKYRFTVLSRLLYDRLMR